MDQMDLIDPMDPMDLMAAYQQQESELGTQI